MSQVSGKVEQVKSRATQFGDFYQVVVNGKAYEVGKFAPRGISTGDFVTFEFDAVQKGQYTNLNIRKGTLRKDDNPSPQATATAPPTAAPFAGKSAYVPFDERQEIISKQAALNTAIAMCQLAATSGAVPVFPAKTKDSDKLGLLQAWVLETTEKVYKLATGRDLDTSAFGAGKPEVGTKATVAKAEEAIASDGDTGYNEY